MLEVGFGVKTSWNSSTMSRRMKSFQSSLGWERWFEGCLEILQEFISHFPYGKISSKPPWKQQEVGPTWMRPGCFSFIFCLTQDLGICGKFRILDLAGEDCSLGKARSEQSWNFLGGNLEIQAKAWQ